MLAPRLAQCVWKKSAWYPSGPGAFVGVALEGFDKFLQEEGFWLGLGLDLGMGCWDKKAY